VKYKQFCVVVSKALGVYTFTLFLQVLRSTGSLHLSISGPALLRSPFWLEFATEYGVSLIALLFMTITFWFAPQRFVNSDRREDQISDPITRCSLQRVLLRILGIYLVCTSLLDVLWDVRPPVANYSHRTWGILVDLCRLVIGLGFYYKNTSTGKRLGWFFSPLQEEDQHSAQESTLEIETAD
jgi:hypothetical protein